MKPWRSLSCLFCCFRPFYSDRFLGLFLLPDDHFRTAGIWSCSCGFDLYPPLSTGCLWSRWCKNWTFHCNTQNRNMEAENLTWKAFEDELRRVWSGKTFPRLLLLFCHLLHPQSVQIIFSSPKRLFCAAANSLGSCTSPHQCSWCLFVNVRRKSSQIQCVFLISGGAENQWMVVLHKSNFSSGGGRGGIKQLLLRMTGPALDKRQFALCFPVAYSTLFGGVSQ